MRISKFSAHYAALIFTLALALLLSACASMPQGKPDQGTQVASLQAQLYQAQEALAKTAGSERTLVFVGAALNSQSTAFQSDVLAVQKRLAGFDMPMQSLIVSNPPADLAARFPAATQQNLSEVFSRVGAWSDKYPITVVVLMSSHGNVGQLAIEIAGQAYPPIRSATLNAWLRRINPATPTVVLLSACYSGSFVPALADGYRVLLTASAADRSSFGCSPNSTNTWFIESLLEQGLRPELSWGESFKRTARHVDAKEREMQLVPSLPQASIPIFWVDRPLSDWLRGTKP
jgi:hypothetical protein